MSFPRGRREVVVFKGVEFIRFPDSRSKSARRYFNPFRNGRRLAGMGSLHREIWKDAYGPIPPGHQIHHRDEDPGNNDLGNLVCLSPAEHSQEHAEAHREARRAFIEGIRPLAAEWHGSDAGRAWHVDHGRRTWEGREPEPRSCAECGASYGTLAHRDTDRFCSRACISRHNERTRRYYEDRACAVCGGPFNVKKSKPQRTCSRKCAWVLRRVGSPPGVQSDC